MSNGNLAEKNLSSNVEQLDSHRQFYKVYFDDNAMDFFFQLILGGFRNGGGEIGEAFYVAAQVASKTPNWAPAWRDMAERVEHRAREALAGGHIVTARDAFLRSSYYHRAAHGGMPLGDADFIKVGNKIEELFREGAGLLDWPADFFEIPFEGGKLNGVFISPHRKDNLSQKIPRKTIFAIGGGETFIEDVYFHLGPHALARGYNFVTANVPGQGMTPAAGLYFRAEVERATRLVMDYIVARPDVDTRFIATYGASLGGYMAPRAAAYDERVTATCGNYGMTDFHRILKAMAFRRAKEMAEITPFNQRTVDHLTWRWGIPVNQPSKIIEACADYQLDTSRLKCPVLLISSAGEYINPVVREMQDEFLSAVPHSNKKLIVAAAEDGASGHCIMENTALIASFLFDWLDEVFK